jgi:hypothetical protein
MGGFFVIRVWHGGDVCLRPGVGLLASASPDSSPLQYPAVLAYLPPQRADIGMLIPMTETDATIAIPPHPYCNPILPAYLVAREQERHVSLLHPPSLRYLSAGPIVYGDDIGDVVASAERAGDHERFELVAVPPSLVMPPVLAKAGAIERLLREPPGPQGIIRYLQQPDRDGASYVLDAALPLLSLAELAALAKSLLADPSLLERLASVLSDDVWAGIGLPRLREWLAWRARSASNGADRKPGSRRRAAPGTRPRKLAIAEDLDFLAHAGFQGIHVSFGHACNALARRSVRPRRNVCAIATARNEGIYLLEWIAYHRSVGVEEFFIYSNDNDDGSDALLSALADAGVIVWIDNKVRAGGHAQPKAYAHALGLLPEVLDFRWALIIDLDEFFVFDPGRFASVVDFVEWQEKRSADAIALNWVDVGSSGEYAWRDGPVTRRFTHLFRDVNAHIKAMCRPALFMHSNAHFPIDDERHCAVFRHSTGELHSFRNAPVPDAAPAFSDHPNAEFACIYHYFFKSAEEYLWKFSRNRGDHPTMPGIQNTPLDTFFLRYFMRQHQATDFATDDRIGRCGKDLDAEIARLKSLKRVATALAEVQQAYRSRIAAVKLAYRSGPAIVELDDLGRSFLEIAGVPTSAREPGAWEKQAWNTATSGQAG